MINLENFGSTPVTLLKKTSHKGDYLSIIKELIGNGNARIFSVHENQKTIKYLNSYIELRHSEIKSQPLIYGDTRMKKCDLYLSDFKTAKNILLENLKKKNIDFCSVLLINDFHFDSSEKSYLILLWLEMFKRSQTRPYLLITTDCYLIPELPFDLDKISIQEFGKSKQDIDIIYHNDNYSPNSSELMEEVSKITQKLHNDYPVSKDEKSLWIVFYSGKKNLSLLNRKLYDSLPDANIYSYTNIEDFSKISQKGSRTIITIDQMYEDNMFLEPDGVIDSMVSEYKNEEDKLFYKYSSKQSSEVKTSYSKKGFCYRMCTEEFFNELQKVQISSFSLTNLEKKILELSLLEIDIMDFFSPLVKKEKISNTLEKLKQIHNISADGKITSIGKETKNINLKITNGSLLLDWIKSGEEGFPMIVFLVFSEINFSFIQFPKRNSNENRKEYNERKKSLIKTYYNIEYETIFELYLKIFVSIIASEKTINIKNYNLLCKKYSLNYSSVKEVFSKIKYLTNYFKKSIKIGIFNVDNLLHLSKEYLEKYYYNDLGKLVDKEKRLYSFKNGEIYKLESFKHFDNFESCPEKIISFEKCKVNNSENSIQKSKNLIYYFTPLVNVYIEN